MSDETNETPDGDEASEAAATDEELVDGEPSEDQGTGDEEPADDGAADDAADDAEDDAGTDGDDDAAKESPAAASERKAKADAVIAQRTVQRRTVTSRRVTPKAGAKPAAKAAADAPKVVSKARDAKKTESVSRTATPPSAVYDKGPSPWWVPAIMFGLLIVGALVIMANYIGVFGDPSNLYLVIGLGFILGGIVAATQYR